MNFRLLIIFNIRNIFPRMPNLFFRPKNLWTRIIQFDIHYRITPIKTACKNWFHSIEALKLNETTYGGKRQGITFPLIASEFYRKITTGLAFQPWPGMRLGKKRTESPVFIIASQSTRNPIVTPSIVNDAARKPGGTKRRTGIICPRFRLKRIVPGVCAREYAKSFVPHLNATLP